MRAVGLAGQGGRAALAHQEQLLALVVGPERAALARASAQAMAAAQRGAKE